MTEAKSKWEEPTWERMKELLVAKRENHLRNMIWKTPRPTEPTLENNSIRHVTIVQKDGTLTTT